MPQDKQLIESELLVVRWKRGDRAAFDGLVKLWEQSLFYYLRRLLNCEADAWELLQETFVFYFACAIWSIENRIASAELASREQSLRIEYRLADLADRLEKR